jgi:hypothetical protein
VRLLALLSSAWLWMGQGMLRSCVSKAQRCMAFWGVMNTGVRHDIGLMGSWARKESVIKFCS